MAGLRFSVLTTEYVKVPIKGSEVGRPVDPSMSGIPEMAFVNLATDPDRTPGPSDWHDGEWERHAGQTIAKCLVGPVAAALTPGTYGVWVRFTAAGETPVLRVGSLTVE